MQLERIAITLRRRSPWEALDLGQAMLRAWRGPLLRAWLGTYLPVALLLFALLWEHLDWAGMVLWWIKPAFDRVLLFVYGRALFGAAPTLREVYRELPRLLRHSGLLAGLSWRRFDPARSFVLPVAQLEDLRGREARQRIRVLGARTRGYAVWLTLVLANMSAVLGFSIMAAADWLQPVDTESLFDWATWMEGESQPWMMFLISAAFMVADSIIEPLYVGCGFSLYLNRRTELEAWDVELAFRRMAQRLEPGRRPAVAGGVLAALCATALCLAVPDAAHAQAAPAVATDAGTARSDTVAAPPSAAKQAIVAVLEDPVFGREVPVREWRYRDRKRAQDEEAPGWLKRLEGIAEFMAAAGRGIVAVALGVLAGLALYWLWRRRESTLRNRRPGYVPPASLFGMDMRVESLPQDVVAAAREKWAAGDVVAALSLLYRGALVALIHRAGVEFRAGDTEDDCERRVDGRIDAPAFAYFRDLLSAWRGGAYAHNALTAVQMEVLLAGWGRHFAELRTS